MHFKREIVRGIDDAAAEDLGVTGRHPLSAPSQSVPGTRICWVVAPAARIAATAAFADASHCVGLTALGSFMRPKRTFDVEAKWPAIPPKIGKSRV